MTEGPAATLYRGHVMHMRLLPRRHRFRYRVFSLLVDLDRIDAILSRLRLLGHNRTALMSLQDRDHGPRDGGPLRPWVDAQLKGAGLPPARRVSMLCFPRMLGYVFNPLTVYYCYDADDRLQSLVYEVKNTFGDQIAYALPAGDAAGGAYRQQQGKEMYVSPFIDMDKTYRFSVNAPDEKLALRIREAGPEGETLIATITGRGEPLTDRALMRAFLAYPLMSFRVFALIHWHALRLFLKGIRFHRYSQSETARKRAA
ncbi:DUF1365 domain-containing protein [Halovulum dunhuangense]|uniref:DUF1365 domain-containing protein n=1 Tax=Halovulum dunhuangense TaxID=1505036 RepID=A0A849L1E3_9RHOB|nr:DUF1365 domain-containing protein [Halovulum dunhuangense]NNU80049.1 DUF1365 domain-containing protein [Halovulum dunhuangense]